MRADGCCCAADSHHTHSVVNNTMFTMAISINKDRGNRIINVLECFNCLDDINIEHTFLFARFNFTMFSNV